MGRPPGHLLPAAEADALVARGPGAAGAPPHREAELPSLLRMPPLTRGHTESVRLLEQSVAVAETRALYREALGHDVYFRPTGAGLSVLALDPTAPAMVGIGLLKQLLPSRTLLEQHLATYRGKRSRMTRSSAEERLSLHYVNVALGNGLALPVAGDLIFVCQEWAFPLDPTGSRKLDLLALDMPSRRLVVIELKSGTTSAGRGGTPQHQAAEYARLLHDGRQFFTPFFERICAAMACAYDGPVLLKGLAIDDSRPPGSLVLHADQKESR